MKAVFTDIMKLIAQQLSKSIPNVTILHVQKDYHQKFNYRCAGFYVSLIGLRAYESAREDASERSAFESRNGVKKISSTDVGWYHLIHGGSE